MCLNHSFFPYPHTSFVLHMRSAFPPLHIGYQKDCSTPCPNTGRLRGDTLQRCARSFYLERLLKAFDWIIGVSLQAVKSSKVNCYNISKMYCFRDKLMVFLWVIPKTQIINMQMLWQDGNQIKFFILPLRSLNWK